MSFVSIVIPEYNEEKLLETFWSRLENALGALPSYSFEVIFVNDGSQDETQSILENISAGDQRVRIIELSRNFGHQAALCAGLEAARGDLVITMDGDGQHPPEMIGQMLKLADDGYEIVLTQRLEDKKESFFKRRTSAMFYRFINRIGDTQTTPGAADFRLLDRKVLDNLLKMPEYHRYLRGMVAWLGFKTVILPYTPEERIAGKSKYSFKKMVRLGSDAIFSFSMAPLYIGLSAGAVFLILAIIEAIYVLSFWIRGDTSSLAPGWSSLMFMMLIIGAVLMIILGFIGIYVGYIFQEVKHRPVYVVKKTVPEENPEDQKHPEL